MTDLVESTLALLREGTLPIMLPLAVCGLGIGYLIAERSLLLFGRSALAGWLWPPRRRRIMATRTEIARSLDEYLESASPGARNRVLHLCSTLDTPYTAFVASLLEDEALLGSDLGDLQVSLSSRQQEARIVRGLDVLSMLAKVAPLIGLFGTVTGMIQTFRVMMLASTSDPRALSSGISIALLATEVGLGVALPAVVASAWLGRRATTLLEEISVVSVRLRHDRVKPEEVGP